MSGTYPKRSVKMIRLSTVKSAAISTFLYPLVMDQYIGVKGADFLRAWFASPIRFFSLEVSSFMTDAPLRRSHFVRSI